MGVIHTTITATKRSAQGKRECMEIDAVYVTVAAGGGMGDLKKRKRDAISGSDAIRPGSGSQYQRNL